MPRVRRSDPEVMLGGDGVRTLAALFVTVGIWSQIAPGAKSMFYDPGDRGAQPAQPAHRLRSIDFAQPFFHCGIHYWLETETGIPVAERAASAMAGKFTVHLRNNIGDGFLTVWDVNGEGRELTPKDEQSSGGGRWSGHRMSDEVYVVPGVFEFATGESPTHLVIVWARSQSEVAHNAARARERVKDMPAWMPIVRETDESTPGAIGTYVVNRTSAGVVAEIVFRSR
jgi:hypothetical protein